MKPTFMGDGPQGSGFSRCGFLNVMPPVLDRKHPSAADLEQAAHRRLPEFVWEYLYCGMGHGDAVKRNRHALDRIKLVPRHLVGSDETDMRTEFLGQTFSAPFGVAPVGLGGLAWPHSAESLARAAGEQAIPFVASTFAMASLETLYDCAGPCAWFQLYRPNVETIEEDLLHRAETTGYDVLLVTVDVPAPMRRDHDIRNGFSVPVRFDHRKLWQAALHPQWTFAMAREGFPSFQNLLPYIPNSLKGNDALHYLSDITTGHVTPGILRRLRKRWNGKLLVKGVLSPREAAMCQDLGVDGIVVSNHGGRQLAAAPAPCDMIRAIRSATGSDFALIADGGVRNGLDIARLLFLGADFVMMGRPFYYAVAALGHQGARYIMEIFKKEFKGTLAQLGCRTVGELGMLKAG